MSRYFSPHLVCIAFLVFFFALPVRSKAARDKDPECEDPTAWAVFTRIVLKQSSLGSSDIVEWKASFNHETNDILIDTDVRGSNTSTTGSIAMVGGRIMLNKGFKLNPGYEIDALDAPVLSMKLMMIVLGRLFPRGPAEVAGHKEIDRTDKIGIKYASPSASGYIPAPWAVKGEVSKLPGGEITFDLALTFPMKQKNKTTRPYTMQMTGELSMLDHAVFLETDSLEGWTTYGLGPRHIKQAAGTILDYGATADQETGYRTIGDIRTFITAENHPGIKDSTKDFTGLWKEKCEQAFGLQIAHQGNEGKYSVVFCGPGGCGDPSESRLTFITEDNQWEIVSEDELIQIGQSGNRERYYRCTKKTNSMVKNKR
ncbi:MAG: hypothetical protein V2B20_23350 [Pseudomonadota bacterium]